MVSELCYIRCRGCTNRFYNLNIYQHFSKKECNYLQTEFQGVALRQSSFKTFPFCLLQTFTNFNRLQRWVKIEIWKEKNCKTRIERGRPSGLIIVPHFDVTGSNHEWEFFSPICPRLIEVWIFEELLVFEQWKVYSRF